MKSEKASAKASAKGPFTGADAEDIRDIVGADPSGGSANMGPGMWHVVCEKPFFKVSWNDKKKFFILPFTVVATTNDQAKAGDRIAWKPNIWDEYGSGKQNVKNLLLAVGQSLWENFDVEASKGEQGAELLQAILTGEYIEGLHLLAHAYLQDKKTKPGEVFTKVNWFPYTEGEAQRMLVEGKVPKTAEE